MSATRAGAPRPGRPRDKGNIPPADDPRRELPPRCPEDTPGSIPVDRAAHSPTGDEGHRPGPGQNEHYHPLCVECPAVGQGATDLVGVRRRLGRQARAALRATAREDGAPGARAHPDPEPVPLVPATVVRLVGSLGHDDPRSPGGRSPGRSAGPPEYSGGRRRRSRAPFPESVTRGPPRAAV